MTKGTTKQAQTTPAPEEKKTRTVLTPTERIAKLKAEAEALEKREADRAKAKLGEAEARLTQVKEQRDRAQAKVDDQEKVVAELKTAAGIEDEAPAES